MRATGAETARVPLPKFGLLRTDMERYAIGI
jgi:hypothetical protein